MPPDPPAAVFAAALARPRPDDRAAAVRDWLVAGGHAPDLRPVLEAALADPDADVRRRAVRLAADVPGEASAYRDPILAALADPAWVVREAAATAAGRLPDPDRSVHARLVALALHDPRPPVREAAAAAAGPRADPEQDFGAAARHRFERQRTRAALALGFVAPGRAAGAVAVLEPLVADGHAKVRRAALLGLARLPPDAAVRLLPTVVRRCFDADLRVAVPARGLFRRLVTVPAAAPLAPLEMLFGVPPGLELSDAAAELLAGEPFRSAWEETGGRCPPGRDLPRALAVVCERVLAAGQAPRGGLAPPSPSL